jgi:diguanylate cyclase (GGDEF)-like protein
MTDTTGDLIRRISIFSDLTPEEVGIALSHMTEMTLEKDDLLFNEGDEGREMYVILRGMVMVFVTTKDNEKVLLAEMGGGSFFGEMSMIELLPRSASCSILERTELLTMNDGALRELMSDKPAIAEKILYRILTTTTHRLHSTSALLSDMVQWGEKARLRVITDEFTGLYNRRFLDEELRAALRKAQATHKPLSMAMVDLDHFGSVNKTYNEAFGDTVILRASQAFREGFRQTDILARYGGDEFAFLFPETSGKEALRLCAEVVARVSQIEFPEHPEFRITASMGVATVPEHAETVETLCAQADKALYEAKEAGRNRATLAQKTVRPKKPIPTIAERTRTIDRILALIEAKSNFLLLGHELPDEDCVSSLVAMALLVTKFGKSVSIYIRDAIPDQLSFLMNMCSYNKIPVHTGPVYVGARPDTVFVLDTPKPDMVAHNPDILAFIADPTIPIVEFDHHLSADAAYSGDAEYCMVTKATSTCELIALFCSKLAKKGDILAKYGIEELFTRNLVLCMLTGIIGDTRMGVNVKSNRETFFYKFFSKRLSTILQKTKHKDSSNYGSMRDISASLQALSVEERDLHQMLLDHARYAGRIGYMTLDAEESINILSRVDYTVFVKVIKSVTDFISEQSGMIGMTVYYDMPEVSDLIQFRIRLSRNVTEIDLRAILLDFEINDGGGHPGAIGFRIPKDEMRDLDAFVSRVLERLEALESME